MDVSVGLLTLLSGTNCSSIIYTTLYFISLNKYLLSIRCVGNIKKQNVSRSSPGAALTHRRWVIGKTENNKCCWVQGLPLWLGGEDSACHAGATNSIPESGRFPGGEHGNPLHSCLENPVDREACQARVRRVTKSQTGLKRLSTHAHIGFRGMLAVTGFAPKEGFAKDGKHWILKDKWQETKYNSYHLSSTSSDAHCSKYNTWRVECLDGRGRS